eukprot:TRINITY_DN39898_c0_g1_i1.p1 TRINITY_DN39898_c0_g1~~TRINITY_DN39898_c0_g1_i1.p1  ORF type:complete len:529 (-),score=120.35 TRINITY_DN39898_c0_g1_i1:122-1708(-)
MKEATCFLFLFLKSVSSIHRPYPFSRGRSMSIPRKVSKEDLKDAIHFVVASLKILDCCCPEPRDFLLPSDAPHSLSLKRVWLRTLFDLISLLSKEDRDLRQRKSGGGHQKDRGDEGGQDQDQEDDFVDPWMQLHRVQQAFSVLGYPRKEFYRAFLSQIPCIEFLIAFGWLLESKDLFFVFAFVHLLDGIDAKPGGRVQVVGSKDGMDTIERLLSRMDIKVIAPADEVIQKNHSLLRTSGSQIIFEKRIASLFSAKRKLKKKVQSLGDEVFFDPLVLHLASKQDTDGKAVGGLRDRFRAESQTLRKAKQFSRWRDCFLEWVSKQIHDHEDVYVDDPSAKEGVADKTWVDGFRHLLKNLEASRTALQWINESWESTKRVKLSSSWKEKEMKSISESIYRLMDSLEMTEMPPHSSLSCVDLEEQMVEKFRKDVGVDADLPYSMDLETLEHYFQAKEDTKAPTRRKTTHDAAWRQKSSLMAVDHIFEPIADTARSSTHTMGKLHSSLESAMERILIAFSNHQHGKKCQFIAS